MRTASRLTLLAALTATVLTCAAPTASAQVEITNESANGAHCGAVTPTLSGATGGCFFHADSEGAFWSINLFGEPLTECTVSFDGRVNENGHGYLYNQVFGGGAPCVIVACNATSGPGFRPWELAMDEPAPGAEHLIYNFCIVYGGVHVECTIDTALSAESHSAMEFTADQSRCAEDDTLHFTAHWSVLADPGTTPPRPEIEITH